MRFILSLVTSLGWTQKNRLIIFTTDMIILHVLRMLAKINWNKKMSLKIKIIKNEKKRLFLIVFSSCSYNLRVYIVS